MDTRRIGPVTTAEQDIVDRLVADHPRDLSPTQVKALAATLRRRPDVVRTCIARAKARLVSNADRYAEAHMDAVDGAIKKKDFETAGKLSQWALEKIGDGGERIVEASQAVPVNPRIFIGLKLGGLALPAGATLDADVTEIADAPSPTHDDAADA